MLEPTDCIPSASLGAGSPRARAEGRLLRLGAASLTDQELLLLLLPASDAARRAADDLAASGGPARLVHRSARELAQRKGIGPKGAVRVLAALELGGRARRALLAAPAYQTPQQLFERYRHLALLPEERVLAVALNRRQRILAEEVVARGGAASCAVQPADILRPAVREGAVGLVVLHTHPSGDPTPSAEDATFTRRLEQACGVVGLALLDHIVVADAAFVSFAERGWLGR